MTKIVTVVAAALVDSAGRVLVTQRPAGKDMAGLWEFPGGKLEASETPEAALVRELDEELGITVAMQAMQPIGFVSHRYERFHLVMLLYGVREWAGLITGHDGQAWQWVEPDDLGDLAMPPADAPLIAPVQVWAASCLVL